MTRDAAVFLPCIGFYDASSCQRLVSFTITDAFKELQGLLYAVAFGDEAEAPWNTYQVVAGRVLFLLVHGGYCFRRYSSLPT